MKVETHIVDKLLLLAVFIISALLILYFGSKAIAAPDNPMASQIMTGLFAAFAGASGSIATLVNAIKNTPPSTPPKVEDGQ